MHIKQQFEEPFRSHLGMSLIGSECERFLWYHFRWFQRNEVTARKYRLFSVGHRTEPLVRAELRAIGVQFLDTVDVDGKQITVSSVQGHYGGSCDGVFVAPRYGLYVPTLLEVKTSKTGADFSNLAKKKMATTKPTHFIQNSCYGKALKIHYCLYIAENKNDSDRYVELVKLDWTLAEQHEQKAFKIIGSQTPPSRISEKETFYLCKMCSMRGVCHGNEVPQPNCRNCQHAVPVEEGAWYCNHWQAHIPKVYWIQGCPQHLPLPR